MAGKRITVIISQAQGKNPAKRHLEEEIATQLMLEGAAEVSLVPHLYDLTPDHSGMLFLKSVPGDIIVLAWLFPRAIHWTLDRDGVKGQPGQTLINQSSDEEEDEADEDDKAEPAQGIGSVNVPNRRIYTLDLRVHTDPQVYLQEIRRIVKEAAVQPVELMSWIGGQPEPSQLNRYLNPSRALDEPGVSENGSADSNATPTDASPLGLPIFHSNGNGNENGNRMEAAETVRRRWYPIIDYSRCTNCMECIDFCLFGVYGLDASERILVEEQDNCKKGCPACSRVCPANAIVFPEHKTAAIAGADVGSAGNLKIDLSKLFGAPSALEVAALERDVELVADGREAVGLSVGIPKRQSEKSAVRDKLDDLMDGLDDLDL